MKTKPSKTKFFFENLSPSSTLSYTTTKKSQRVNLQRESHWGSWSSWWSALIAWSLGFTVISFLIRFLIDSILFRVLSEGLFWVLRDRVFFRNSSNRFFSSPVLFLHHIAIFLSNPVINFFFSKTDVLFCSHYNSQKQLAQRVVITSTKLIAKKMKKYLIETQSIILKIYVINFSIYMCH